MTRRQSCCRWPTDAIAIRKASQTAIDWRRFVKLAQRHRVQGFARIGLEAAEIAVPPGLVAAHRRQIARNLLLLDEAARIAKMLADADIPTAFLKGATLAELAYGDQAVKQTLDNDLLVAPGHAYKFGGRRFDCGDKAGYIQANIALALDRPEIGPAIRKFIDTL